jgi:hypothetical protein
MSDGNSISKISGSDISKLINNGADFDIELKQPFAQPIYLIDTHVAGTTHVDGIDGLTESLSTGVRLTLQRDKDNPFDCNAIIVLSPHNERIGFVPCDVNEILARLMDGGKVLYGETTSIEHVGTWNKISMKVYLDD